MQSPVALKIELAQGQHTFPKMGHDDPNAVGIEPGGNSRTGWRSTKTGDFDFACMIPGHYEAGIVGRIVI
jgi:uncharacterized cupredoxin-like copper-binding protein